MVQPILVLEQIKWPFERRPEDFFLTSIKRFGVIPGICFAGFSSVLTVTPAVHRLTNTKWEIHLFLSHDQRRGWRQSMLRLPFGSMFSIF